jgi:hypothetical protein
MSRRALFLDVGWTWLRSARLETLTEVDRCGIRVCGGLRRALLWQGMQAQAVSGHPEAQYGDSEKDFVGLFRCSEVVLAGAGVRMRRDEVVGSSWNGCRLGSMASSRKCRRYWQLQARIHARSRVDATPTGGILRHWAGPVFRFIASAPEGIKPDRHLQLARAHGFPEGPRGISPGRRSVHETPVCLSP